MQINVIENAIIESTIKPYLDEATGLNEVIPVSVLPCGYSIQCLVGCMEITKYNRWAESDGVVKFESRSIPYPYLHCVVPGNKCLKPLRGFLKLVLYGWRPGLHDSNL